MICDSCNSPSDVLIPVAVDDDEETRDEDWCPACVADATLEEFIGLDPGETP